MSKEPRKKKEKTETSHFDMLEARQKDREDSPGERKKTPLTLTRREKQILGCSALGLTATDTAEYLLISETTTRNHQGNIHQKMGANSMVSAFYEAYRRGIMTDEYMQALENDIIKWKRDGRKA